MLHLVLAVMFDCVEEDWSFFFERSYEARFCSDGSMSIHLLSCIGMVAVVPTSSLGCGFAFAFDLAATTLMLVLWHLIFWWICRNFCIVLIWIDHIFDRSIGYSDPWFTDQIRPDQIRISIPYLKCWKLVVTSKECIRDKPLNEIVLSYQCPWSRDIVQLQQHP